MLNAVRLTGSVFLNGRFTAPFDVTDPTSYAERVPMARLRHVSILHLVVAGSFNFETAGERRLVAAGDLLFQPFPDRYRFWSGEPSERALASDIVRAGPIEGLWTVDYGGGGEEARLVCGFLESSEFLFTPVFRTLPRLLVEQTAADSVGALIASTVREIVTLVAAATPGTQAVLGRLMELLFVEILRRMSGSFRPARRAGSPPSTIRSSVARCSVSTAIPDTAGPSTNWPAMPVRRARSWLSGSRRSSGGRRSSISRAGAFNSPPNAFASAMRASRVSPRPSDMNPRPPSVAPSSA
jgi:hypothetical protein